MLVEGEFEKGHYAGMRCLGVVIVSYLYMIFLTVARFK